MGGGGKGGTTTQSVSIPPEVLARYNAVNARAENVAQQPFMAYPGQFVAPLTGTQQQGIAQTSQSAGLAQPYYGAAAGMTLAGSQGVGPLTQGQIAYYQNPFTQSVVNPTLQALQQQQGQERAQQQAQAIRAGAFGGDRAGIERANLARQQALGTAQAIAPLYAQGYQTGVQTAAGQQGVIASDLQRQLAAGQQLGGLGAGAQAAALQGAQAQIGAGTLEQQTQQADLTARYQQFLQERGFPYQQAQFLANIAMGTGALSGSTTTTTQPTSFFSDERMKENVHPIGETFDGQTIYKYNYRGEPGTQIGLIAQEVERKHPDAVGQVGGMKTVDYDRATERAGGLGAAMASMGGAVHEPGAFARGGYAPGGLVDPNDIQAILASQRQSFGPFASGGPYGQATEQAPFSGAGGIVPTNRLPTPKLMTAGPAPRQQEGGFKQAMSDIAQGGKFAEKAGNLLDKLSPEEEGAAKGAEGFGKKLAGFGKDVKDVFSLSHGGGIRPHYAQGGGKGINPYDMSQSSMDYFPEEVLESGEEKRELLKPGQAPSSGGGGGGLGSAIGTASNLVSLGTAAAKAAPYLMAMLPFSDRRLKHDVEPIGKTYDGQNIYRYHMGDGATRMGLMAQEVAEHNPDAVARGPGGYLMLDYDKATQEAVPYEGGVRPRGGYQQGGPPSEEGFDIIKQYWPRVERTESGGKQFDPETGQPLTSPKGAIGVAQVMPKTAPEAARLAGVEFDEQRYRNDPDYNRTLGQAYLREQYRTFGDPALALAAYNAGPGNVRAALARAEKEGGSYTQYLPTETQQYLIKTGAAPRDAVARAEGVKPSKDFVSRLLPTKFGTQTRENPQGQQFESPMDFLTSRQFLQPLAIGLGTMAASPSRYLGSAILQGIGGGFSAYSDLEKQQAGVEQTKALTEGTRAATREQEAATARGNIFEKAGRLVVQYLDPKTGRYVTIDGARYLRLPDNLKPSLDARDIERLKEDAAKHGELPPDTPATGAGLKPSGTTTTTPAGMEGAAPVAAPGAAPEGGVMPSKPISSPTMTIIGPNDEALKAAEREAIELEGYTFKEDREKILDQNRQILAQQIKARNEGYALTSGLNDIAKPLAGLAAGQQIAPGAFARVQYTVINAFNDALRTVLPESMANELAIGKEAQTQYQLAEKASAALREAKQRSSDLRAISALEELEKSIADPRKTADTAAEILAGAYVDKQKMIDEALFTEKYARSQPTSVARGASGAYKAQYKEEQYNAEKAVIKKMLRDQINGVPLISYLLGQKDPRMDPAIAARITPQAINEMYGVDVTRYFLNTAK